MAFTNRIRLPFKLSKPQFVEESTDYRLANGVTKVLEVVIRKVYEGDTDYWPEKIHERFKIALRHDSVKIEGDKYIGFITQEGDYQIEWPDFLNYPLGPAKFKANVTPFNATNSNCGTCEEFTQVVCNDDDAGTLDEDTTYVIPVLDNDEICCSPITISLVTFNSTYLSTCIVNANNEIEIHTKTPLPIVNDVLLVTYRAQCDNGQYDEANIIGDLNGTDPTPVCNAPTSLLIQDITDTTVTITWSQPLGSLSYEWQLFLASDLGTPVQTGTADTADNNAVITGLTPGESYRFYVRSVCDGGSFSGYVYIDFTMNPPSGDENCGHYHLTNSDPANVWAISYIDCNGMNQNINLPPLHERDICALQNSFGDPVDITPESPLIDISYVDLC